MKRESHITAPPARGGRHGRARVRLRWPLGLGIATVLALAGAVTAYRVAGWANTVRQAPSVTCDRLAPVAARLGSGRPWDRHRRWLEPRFDPVPPGLSYVIQNQRTGDQFRWLHRPESSTPPRFYVPTRYATLVNRSWRGDRWVYCLVLAPNPPFHFHRHGFDTASWATPAVTAAGATLPITITVRPDQPATVNIDIEVQDVHGVKVAQWWLVGQALSPERTSEYTVHWQIAEGTPPGIYAIKIGLFAPDASALYHWNSGTGVFEVR